MQEDYWTIHLRQKDGPMKTYKLPLSKIKSVHITNIGNVYLYLTSGMAQFTNVDLMQEVNLELIRSKGIPVFTSQSMNGFLNN